MTAVERLLAECDAVRRERDEARAERDSAFAALARMTAERDAWKALAMAERIYSGARAFGSDERRNAAFAAVQKASAAILALGVDPEALR